jgi:hypothetical protein
MQIYDVPMEGPVLIAPLGDIQFTGNDPNVKGGCSVGGLKSHLSWLRRTAEQLGASLSIIGTGDYVDMMSPSNRDKYKANGFYSNVTRAMSFYMGHIVEELAEILSAYISPEEVEVLLMGHHYFPYEDGKFRHSDEHLAHLLGIKNAPHDGAAYLRYQWSTTTYNVLAAHGQGNGQSLAYGLNKLDKLAGGWSDVQAHVTGHTHKLGSIKKAQLAVRDGKVIHDDVRLITAGAFLRGWVKDELMYPEAGQMGALPIGGSALYVEEDSTQPQGHSSFALLR